MHSHGRCHRSIVLEHSDLESHAAAAHGTEAATSAKLGKSATSGKLGKSAMSATGQSTGREGRNTSVDALGITTSNATSITPGNASANAGTSGGAASRISKWPAGSSGGAFQPTPDNQREASDADVDDGDEAWSETPSVLLRAWPAREVERLRVVQAASAENSWAGVRMRPPQMWSVLQAVLFVDSVLADAHDPGPSRGPSDEQARMNSNGSMSSIGSNGATDGSSSIGSSDGTRSNANPAGYTAWPTAARNQVLSAMALLHINGSVLLSLVIPPPRFITALGSYERRRRLAKHLKPVLPARRFRAFASFEAAGVLAMRLKALLNSSSTSNAEDTVFCVRGLKGGATDPGACCPSKCKTCGGPGCSARPGGRQCCRNGIVKLARSRFVASGVKPPPDAGLCRHAHDVGCIIPRPRARRHGARI